jgi:YfiH family protein
VIERHTDDSEYLLFEHLAAVSGVTHAVFTRRRGYSSVPFAGLNASFTTGDDPVAVRRNRQAILATLGMPTVGTHCVHGNAVAVVERDALVPAGPDDDPVERLRQRLRQQEADALLTDVPGFAFCWAFGDCAPILLYDPAHHAIGLIHAGWRGTAAGIVLRAVATMRDRYDTDPGELLAGLGPAIGGCCYEVSETVREAFAALPDAAACASFEERADVAGETGTRLYLDIGGSNYRQLLRAGLAPEHVEVSGYCTGCRTDLFYSHRREPWPSGRFAVAIGLRAD